MLESGERVDKIYTTVVAYMNDMAASGTCLKIISAMEKYEGVGLEFNQIRTRFKVSKPQTARVEKMVFCFQNPLILS